MKCEKDALLNAPDTSQLRTSRILQTLCSHFVKKRHEYENWMKWPQYTSRVSHNFCFRSRQKKSTERNSFDVLYKNHHSLWNNVEHKMQKEPVSRTARNTAKHTLHTRVLHSMSVLWSFCDKCEAGYTSYTFCFFVFCGRLMLFHDRYVAGITLYHSTQLRSCSTT